MLIIKNARVICPKNNMDTVADILIKNGRIEEIKKDIRAENAQVIDAKGLVAMPGLVDMHVHLRDPGFEYKEDIFTGCEAAAAGGVTSVVAMPNTNPPCDNAETIKYILEKAKSAKAKVYPVGTITKGMKGQELSDFKALKEAGAVAVSDDGKPVKNAALMQSAMEQCFEIGLPVISHAEDFDIIGKGIINKGKISRELGVAGMDRSSEDSITAREIALAGASGSQIHIAHVSTKGSAAIIEDAKKRGIKVTAETCPHYFYFTEKELLKRDADYRMNPPLREEEDRQAIEDAVSRGVFDCITTDHAPHAKVEKADFTKAPNGVLGLETSLAAVLTKLYHTGKLTLLEIARLMSLEPCRILGIEGGELSAGAVADIVLVDIEHEWKVNVQKLHSKSQNSVFKGETLKGAVKYTILNGNMVYERENENVI